jgi:glycosyltransferase involved in cell wall biosynthesis
MNSVVPKKVIVAHDSQVFGGMELFVLLLLKYYDTERYIPIVFVPGYTEVQLSSPEMFIERVLAEKYPLIRPTHPGNLPVFSSVKDIFATAKLFKATKADIVHIHTSTPHRAHRVTLAAKLAGLPVVRSEHLPASWWAQNPNFRFKVTTKLIELLSDKIVPGSDACYNEQLTVLKRNPKKITRSCYGIELGRFNPNHDVRAAKIALGLNPDIPVVGNIARLAPEKGQKYFIDAVPQVLKEYGAVNFLLVGDGPLRQELEAQVDRLGVRDHFIFTGFQKDTVPFMQAMDITVMSSINEGISLAMLEFMAMGKPLVSSREPSFAEMVKDGQDALLVDLESGEAIANGIIKVLNDPLLAKKLGEGAYQTVHAEFSIIKSVEDQMNLYDKLLGIDTRKNTSKPLQPATA